MRLDELTMTTFSAALATTRTVIVPLGATEQHGPHLPLGTDTFQAEEVACRLAQRRPLFVAPAIPYGVCRSTHDHPGTLSITTGTLHRLVIDVCEALHRQGLTHIVLLTGHAGGTHSATLVDAGEELLRRHAGLSLAVVTELDLAAGEGEGLIETEGDSHAGEIETSRMLHSRPHLVQGSAPREFPSFPRGILVRDKRRYWPNGVWGDPSKATAEKGAEIERRVVDALDRLVTRLEAEGNSSSGS